MQTYIGEHFARTRENWAIRCIPPNIWHNEEQLNQHINSDNELNRKHHNSRVQQYANTSDERRKQIENLGQNISEYEITQAIAKLSNRKSVGYDEITAGIFKANKEWIVPIIKQC